MITIANITTKSATTGFGKLLVRPAPAATSWSSVMTLIEQTVQQIKLETKASGRTDFDTPERKYLDGSAERLLVNYADRLYVLPFYCASPVPNEIRKELARDRPLDPVKPGTRRHCTKIPTFGLWYALHGKLREKAAALDAQHTLLARLHNAIVAYSLPNRTQSIGLEAAVAAADAALAMLTSMSAIGFAALESTERGATEAFLAHMTAHFSALQTACKRALDKLNPESAYPCINSRTWACSMLTWDRRTPRKEKIL